MKNKQGIALGIIAAMAVSQNSCYFNSAGHIFDKASYKASVKTSDVRVGGTVYKNSSNDYFIELPRYREGKEVLTQYAVWDEDTRTNKTKPTGETTVVRIPENYALHLTGQSPANVKATPEFMVPADGDFVKRTAVSRLPIVQNNENVSFSFTYTAPGATLLYTLGLMDWLCIDLPITLVENAMAISCCLLVLVSENQKKQAANSSSSGSSGGSSYSPSASSQGGYTTPPIIPDNATVQSICNKGNRGYDLEDYEVEYCVDYINGCMETAAYLAEQAQAKAEAAEKNARYSSASNEPYAQFFLIRGKNKHSDDGSRDMYEARELHDRAEHLSRWLLYMQSAGRIK